MQAKFYVDENVPVIISKVLKKRGIDILTARDVRMLGKSDHDQLSFAVKEQRAVVTHDSDFLKMVVKEKREHYGILFFTKQTEIGKAVEEVERVHLAYNGEELKGLVLFLPQK
tara:strand:+ start:4500 stop:4838 length:339 start_codon:yes stop_codon:yes gene_type:complete